MIAADEAEQPFEPGRRQIGRRRRRPHRQIERDRTAAEKGAVGFGEGGGVEGIGRRRNRDRRLGEAKRMRVEACLASMQIPPPTAAILRIGRAPSAWAFLGVLAH